MHPSYVQASARGNPDVYYGSGQKDGVDYSFLATTGCPRRFSFGTQNDVTYKRQWRAVGITGENATPLPDSGPAVS
jgi:hypothetical protein